MSAKYDVKLGDDFSGPAGAVVAAIKAIKGGAGGAAASMQQFGHGLTQMSGQGRGLAQPVAQLRQMKTGADAAAGGAMRLGTATEAIGPALQRATNNTMLLGAALRMAWGAAKAIGAAVLGFGQRLLSSAGFSSSLEFGLTRFLGSASAAKSEIAAILELSNKYGMDFQKTGEDFKNLVSAGFGAEAAKDMLKLKADLLAMSTGSVEGLGKIESAFAEIAKSQASGRMEADGFNRILENLPVTKMQILEKLAPKLGKSLAELQKTEMTKLPVDKLVEAIKEATLGATGAAAVGETALKKQLETLGGAAGLVQNRAKNFVDQIAMGISSPELTKAVGGLQGIFDSPEAARLAEGTAAGISGLEDAAAAAMPAIAALIEGMMAGWNVVAPAISAVVDGMRSLMGATGQSESSWKSFGKAIGAVFGAIGMGVAIVVAAITLIIDSVVGAYNAIANLPEELSSVWGLITEGISGAGGAILGAAVSLGSSIVSGIASGITGSASWVIDTITSLCGDVIGWAKKILHIGSPSKVFADIGANTAAGFAQGIDAGASASDSAMNGMMAPPPPQGGGLGGGGGHTFNVQIDTGGAYGAAQTTSDPPAFAAAVREMMVSDLADELERMLVQVGG